MTDQATAAKRIYCDWCGDEIRMGMSYTVHGEKQLFRYHTKCAPQDDPAECSAPKAGDRARD